MDVVLPALGWLLALVVPLLAVTAIIYLLATISRDVTRIANLLERERDETLVR